MRTNKYFLYEESVQAPVIDTKMLASIYADIFKREPRSLREDFCGTFNLAAEWVKRDPRNSAVGIDLDKEPLQYGWEHHYAELSPDEQDRLIILNENVMNVTSPKVDMIAAFNFSFYIFKERKSLIDYLKTAHKTLDKKGMICLEMVGGAGFIKKTRDVRTIPHPDGGSFKYIWDQASFDPVTRNGMYYIHFKFRGKRERSKVFSYDWRIWTIPEVREALEEAGFIRSKVYWEKRSKFVPVEKGDNDHTWLAQIVGIKE